MNKIEIVTSVGFSFHILQINFIASKNILYRNFNELNNPSVFNVRFIDVQWPPPAAGKHVGVIAGTV
jgi:hypothetical protein